MGFLGGKRSFSAEILIDSAAAGVERGLERRVSRGRPGGIVRRPPYPARRIRLGLDLRGALEQDDRQMSPSAVASDGEFDRDPGSTSNEGARRSAGRTSWP